MAGSRPWVLRLFGGILYDRDKEEHRQRAKALGIPTIDLVVCNLYPFAEVSKREGVATDELMENIDIGGVSLIRGLGQKCSPCLCPLLPQGL